MRLLPAFLFLSSLVSAQDSLVRFNNLQYRSEFERKAFRQYFKEKNPAAILDLFLSTDANPAGIRGNARERIEQVTNRLAADPGAKKKPEKYVKTVYQDVHASFLKKYELINRFPEIFQTGYYNCVTATALYALVFDKLNIPYSIQEKPTHVFLIAYPNQNNILVETTAPIFGYLTFDDRYKENFVKSMRSQKLIGNSEAESMGLEELFNKYYFQNENINLQQLIGIHYMNDALYHHDKQDYVMALRQLDKAWMFYPTTRIAYMMMSTVVQMLDLQQPKPLDRAVLIARASAFSQHGITPDMIRGEFLQLTEAVLARENNKPLYRQCFDIIYGSITDKDLKSDIAYIYYYEIGRIYLNQGNYSIAKTYFAKALEYQPNNADLGSIFIAAVGNSMRNENNSRAILDTLLNYEKKFPTLRENNNFMSMISVGYLMAFQDAMRDGKAADGEKYQAKFEAMYAANKELNPNRAMIGNAYSAAASYYFKKGLKAKARAVIDKGLQMAPDDYELRQRKQMIR